MIKKKKVAALCKKSYTINMTTRSDGTQWVGTVTALYSMEGMPKMTPEEVAVAFDYSDSERRAMDMNENQNIADMTDDEYSGEILIESPPRDVIIGGTHYLMFNAAGQIMFINNSMLSPIELDSQTNFFMRFLNGNGEHKFLCVKRGLLAQAIIIGTVISEETISEWIADTYDLIHSVETGYKSHSADNGQPDQLRLDCLEGEAYERNYSD